jgi:uncharacterized protein (DUF697 family)/GTP-binding protein EngB required for normal cell division
MSSLGEDFIRTAFAKAYRERAEELGRFNLAIFGKTGVGKSTLINAMFGQDVAATGIGEPVTKAEHLYMHTSGLLGVLDTRGVEIGEDSDAILGELSQYLSAMRTKPLEDQIHVAWYCVRAGDRRFEATEGQFIREVAKLGLPVVLVVTQTPARDGNVHPDVIELVRVIEEMDLPIFNGRAYLTMARADSFRGDAAHGLQDLLDATFLVAPDGVAAALTAVQQVDGARKRAEAEKAIGIAVTAAGAAGATPIPFSDAVVLAPIQLSMMASIAHTYGIKLDTATAASLAATAGATALGRGLVGGLIKMVPGLGSVVGGAISASVASAVTYAMGYAWMQVCVRLARGELSAVGGALDSDAIRLMFNEEFKRQARQRVRGD